MFELKNAEELFQKRIAETGSQMEGSHPVRRKTREARRRRRHARSSHFQWSFATAITISRPRDYSEPAVIVSAVVARSQTASFRHKNNCCYSLNDLRWATITPSNNYLQRLKRPWMETRALNDRGKKKNNIDPKLSSFGCTWVCVRPTVCKCAMAWQYSVVFLFSSFLSSNFNHNFFFSFFLVVSLRLHFLSFLQLSAFLHRRWNHISYVDGTSRGASWRPVLLDNSEMAVINLRLETFHSAKHEVIRKNTYMDTYGTFRNCCDQISFSNIA